MDKFTDIWYRDIDVDIPKVVFDFFNAIDKYLEYEFLFIDDYGFPCNNHFKSEFKESRKSKYSISLVGGVTRDILFGFDFNDIDCACPISFYKDNENFKMHPSPDSISPHYRFGEKLVHFINPCILTTKDPSSDMVIPPGSFDFSINEIHLNKEGRWFAEPKTWFDYDNKILRLNEGRKLSSSIAIRAIRFAIKYNLIFDEQTLRMIIYKFKEAHINEVKILKHLKKIQEDKIENKAFEWLKMLSYPAINNYSNFLEMIDDIDKRVSKGDAIINEVETTY